MSHTSASQLAYAFYNGYRRNHRTSREAVYFSYVGDATLTLWRSQTKVIALNMYTRLDRWLLLREPSGYSRRMFTLRATEILRRFNLGSIGFDQAKTGYWYFPPPSPDFEAGDQMPPAELWTGRKLFHLPNRYAPSRQKEDISIVERLTELNYGKTREQPV